jgi:hypothetical protein
MVNMITCKHIPDRLFRGFTLDVQNSCTHHADFTILPKTHRNDDNDINICAGDRRNNREEKDTAHLETDSTRTRQTSKSLTHSTTKKTKLRDGRLDAKNLVSQAPPRWTAFASTFNLQKLLTKKAPDQTDLVVGCMLMMVAT